MCHPSSRIKSMSGITLCSYKTIIAHLNVSLSLLSTLFHFFKPLPSHNPSLSLINSSLLAWSPLVHSAAVNGESMPSVSVCLFILFSTAQEHFQQPHHLWTLSTRNVLYFFQLSLFVCDVVVCMCSLWSHSLSFTLMWNISTPTWYTGIKCVTEIHTSIRM